MKKITETISTKVTPQEKAALEERASEDGLSLSQYVRRTL
jgi:hypothetical protein